MELIGSEDSDSGGLGRTDAAALGRTGDAPATGMRLVEFPTTLRARLPGRTDRVSRGGRWAPAEPVHAGRRPRGAAGSRGLRYVPGRPPPGTDRGGGLTAARTSTQPSRRCPHNLGRVRGAGLGSPDGARSGALRDGVASDCGPPSWDRRVSSLPIPPPCRSYSAATDSDLVGGFMPVVSCTAADRWREEIAALEAIVVSMAEAGADAAVLAASGSDDSYETSERLADDEWRHLGMALEEAPRSAASMASP